jgi:hypothetical protein
MSRERDRSLKTIEELSTGTCEQLFLALRIAAIERYVTSVGAVPVIFSTTCSSSPTSRDRSGSSRHSASWQERPR